MVQFIAGKDAHLYDKSDWDIEVIPVYFNPEGLPPFTSDADAVRMVKQACFSWSLRYHGHTLEYQGLTGSTYVPGAITVNYADSVVLRQYYDGEVNGMCRYFATRQVAGKWILDGCQIYMNAQHRAFPDRYAQGTMLHEFGHACGIHGHLSNESCVMNTYGMGVDKLTLSDCQMLDNWDPYPNELHPDLSMTCPAVRMPTGEVVWIELEKYGNTLNLTWNLGYQQAWDGPELDNVTVGAENRMWHGQAAQSIYMKRVQSLEMLVTRADLVLCGDLLYLEYAE